MSGDTANPGRRRFLTLATTAVGAVGVGFALVPFVSSMQPSAKARAAGAPVRADISKLKEGQMIRVKWRGKPVWIVNRTDSMLETVTELDSTVSDPASAESIHLFLMAWTGLRRLALSAGSIPASSTTT